MKTGRTRKELGRILRPWLLKLDWRGIMMIVRSDSKYQLIKPKVELTSEIQISRIVFVALLWTTVIVLAVKIHCQSLILRLWNYFIHLVYFGSHPMQLINNWINYKLPRTHSSHVTGREFIIVDCFRTFSGHALIWSYVITFAVVNHNTFMVTLHYWIIYISHFPLPSLVLLARK